MLAGGTTEPAVSLPEAQAFVRVERGEEEALLAGMVRTASELCEAFTRRVLVAREFRETLAVSATWQRLTLSPVRAITQVEGLAVDGSATPLTPAAYAVDIDASGDGWLRLTDAGGAMRVRVTASAGMAGDANQVPEALRHGILRLVAHLFASRDGGGTGGPGSEPPAAVTALWRPFRRMRLS